MSSAVLSGLSVQGTHAEGGTVRTIFSFVMTSLDGYHEGPRRELAWHNVDGEFNQFAIEQMDAADTVVLGRHTYEVMAAYWPTDHAADADPRMASTMNSVTKAVVSRTLEHVEWANTEIIRDDVADYLAKLKEQPGRDIAILGSSSLTASLLPSGVVDEVRIMVNPVILGAGNSLFAGASSRVRLKLLSTRPFRSGNVMHYYEPVVS
jgi:dihydrofolate reductase